MRLNFLSLSVIAILGNIVHCEEEEVSYNKPFYDACANGNVKKVKDFLQDDPSLATGVTPDGETCLHLTAISTSYDVAKLMVELGTDVNIRVTHSKGLEMSPMSWHVYSGNYKIVELLLDSGADINMVFDLDPTGRKATVMDVAFLLARKKDGEKVSDAFVKTLDLLTRRGGKRYGELTKTETEAKSEL